MAMLSRRNPSWSSSPRTSSRLPLPNLFGFRRELDRLFEDFMDNVPLIGGREEEENELTRSSSFSPRMNVSETEQKYEIEVELPGIKKEDINISISDDGQLTIQGEHRHDIDKQDRHFHRVERSYGTFRRSLSLPRDVDPDGIKANMNDGILILTLPKSPEAQDRSRRISVE